MKTLIVCDSVYHGNTKKIADVLAAELDAPVLASSEVTEARLQEYGLVGFGSGIYGGMHYRGLLDFVDKLPLKQKGKAFIFSTNMLGRNFIDMHHKRLRDKLEKKGFEILGEFSCKGYDNSGPLKLIGGINKGKPDEGDFERARMFARTIKEKAE